MELDDTATTTAEVAEIEDLPSSAVATAVEIDDPQSTVHAEPPSDPMAIELPNSLSCKPLDVQVFGASSKRQMAQFSASVISPMACAAAIFFVKDVYILKFGADVGLMGVVGTALAIAGPAFQPITGYCLEKVSLERFFPWETWGRRAPWFFTHCIGAAITSAAIFVPPVSDSTFLCVWYFVWALLGSWFLSVVFTALESARVEAYPTKEERSLVEAFMKISSAIGSSVGTGLPLVVATDAPFHVLLLASVAIFFFGLVSLLGVPAMRKARLPFESRHVGTFMDEFVGLLCVPVVRHLIAYRIVEDAFTTTAITASLYYLTFVQGLLGVERTLYVLLCGLIIGLSSLLLLPCWTQFFRLRRPGVNINVVCCRVMALGLLAPVVLALGDLLPPGVGFAIYILLIQGTMTGQTFWRSIALGWVVDEDCHACQGRRREAMLVGIMNFFAAIGRAVGVGIVLYGLALCGVDMVNCDLECAAQGASAAADCAAHCEEQNLVRQPGTVKIFLRIVYMGIVTLFQLLCAILVYFFPICNARLDAIYAKQAVLISRSQTTPEANRGEQ